MKITKITIAGKEYKITELPRKKNAAWRERVQGEFTEIADMVRGLPDQNVGSTAGVAGLIESFAKKLTGSVDILVDLIFSYSPALRKDAERIDEEAYDSEILEAFWAVAGLAFPFGSLIQRVRGLAERGQSQEPTGESSA